jgi:hypothetical protein
MEYIFHERIQFLTVNANQASLNKVANLHCSTTVFYVQFVEYLISEFEWSDREIEREFRVDVSQVTG